MAEHREEPVPESLMDKISDKFHGGDSSSSSDSDDDRKKKGSSSASSAAADMKAKIYRLFGRERPVHSVLGGGKRKFPDSWKFPPTSAQIGSDPVRFCSLLLMGRTLICCYC